MTKHNINMSGMGQIEFDLGSDNRKINFKGSNELVSISVDAGMQSTYICLNRMHNKDIVVNIFELKGYKMTEIAELVFDLIKIGRPEKLYIDRFGAGLAVKDSLFPLLKYEGYLVSKNGDVIYSLDEMYNRLQSN